MMPDYETANGTAPVSTTDRPEAPDAAIDKTQPLHRAVSTAKTRATQAKTLLPAQVRRINAAVRGKPLPVAAGLAAVAGAVTAVALLRRRAAKARARRRWLPAFLTR